MSGYEAFNEPMIWLAVILLAVIIEGFTVSLISVWFAFAGIMAFVMALLGAPMIYQVFAFLLVAAVLISFTRDMAKTLIKKKIKTNSDSLVGQIGVVIQTIDNLKGEGQVKINGQIWSAKTECPEPITEDTKVEIVSITGVKLNVKVVEDEKECV